MSLLAEIRYHPDSTRIFDALRDLPCPVFLDSGRPSAFAGRYDVLAADPGTVFVTRGDETEIHDHDGRVDVSGEDPLTLIRTALESGSAPGPVTSPLPFVGGAIGYFAYDLGRRYESFAGRARDDVGMPDMIVGIYDWAVVVDHEARRSWLVGGGRDSATAAGWDALQSRVDGVTAPRSTARFEVRGDVRRNLTRSEYAAAFDAIRDHIRRGNCYQVNLTQRFEAPVTGDAWQAYLSLRAANPAPYSAYLDFPEGQVLSSSPELFLYVADCNVETQPIKGTRPRAADPAEDRRLAEALRVSEKDRAENVMIVDLLRNDLGRACAAGSVGVERLFEVRSFATVHHLVSTVIGQLAPGRDAFDLLRGCFPGGSITGAPKLAAMQVIDDLEPNRRGVYCGSIGYIGYDGTMQTNVAIRTLVRRGDSIYAWAGGGIVADSIVDDEYQESLDKAQAMLSILSPRI